MPIQDLRVIQLIDSLEPGGAERMSVTIANSLVEEATFSGIVVTRLEGSLKDSISSNVDYLYFKKIKISIYIHIGFFITRCNWRCHWRNTFRKKNWQMGNAARRYCQKYSRL